MTRQMTFQDLLDAYRLEDRSLFGFVRSADGITLVFDLYHCDDEQRREDDTEYRLDITVAPERFRVVSGMGERLVTDFSADILEARIEGDELRLVADCSFYDPPKGSDIVILSLAGGMATVTEHSPSEAA